MVIVFCQVNNTTWLWIRNQNDGDEVLKTFTQLKKAENDAYI